MRYSQLLTGIKSVASALRKRGLATGDNLVIISGNHVELALMSMAAWRAGGTQSCLSVNLPQGYHHKSESPQCILFIYLSIFTHFSFSEF
jgi:acyl-coenzyme A synthetase/AMP-(fatty) acid ligase